MRRLLWVVPAALLAAPWAPADEPKPDPKAKPAAVPATPLLPAGTSDDKKDEKKDEKKEPAKPADLTTEEGRAAEVKAIQKEYTDGRAAYTQAVRAAKTAEERRAAQQKMPKPADLAKRAWAVVEADEKGQPAFDALVWMQGLGIARMVPGKPDVSDLLLKHHMDNPDIAKTITTASSEKFLRAVAEKATKPADQARALYTLANRFQNDIALKQRQLDLAKRSKADDREEQVERLTKELAAAKKHEQEVETLYERIAADKALADSLFLNRGETKITFGERVKGELFEIRHLSVGKTVPEIVGEDTDGKKFKLSDYRGQVVMLDFWGHW